MNSLNSHRTVVSTFASPHEPTLRPKARKRASAFPAQEKLNWKHGDNPHVLVDKPKLGV